MPIGMLRSKYFGVVLLAICLALGVAACSEKDHPAWSGGGGWGGGGGGGGSKTAPTITSVNNTMVTSGEGGAFQVTAVGSAPITYSLDGSEPAGVSINTATGLITIAGTIADGEHAFTITASNGVPPDFTQSFTLYALDPGHVYAVGARYPYIGKAVGVVVEEWNSGVNGKIISLDEGQAYWGDDTVAYYTSGAISSSDGKWNTDTITSAPGWQTNYPLFKWCVDHGEGWYFPALDEMTGLASVAGAVNTTLLGIGTPLKIGAGSGFLYWTSTEEAVVYAYYVWFGGVPGALNALKGTTGGSYYLRAFYEF